VATPRAEVALPIMLVPGLLVTARLYADQIPALWRLGPVTVADHTRDDSMAAIARRILADAPPRFALAGLSMGGYVAFEIVRQAPERVARLALLSTSARLDPPEITERRRRQIALAQEGRFRDVADMQFRLLVHRSRLDDEGLETLVRLMADETGAEVFVRQQTAIIGRADSRPDLARIACPTLVVVGDGDELIAPENSVEIAGGIPGARLVTIAECGHLSTLERPAQVTAALAEWLQS
jgi:pimeloyl-ACP methyl ester carboxylesterase